MSLTDEQIEHIAVETKSAEPGRDGYILPFQFARAIESAATAPLIERINELEDHAQLDKALIDQLHKSMTDAEWRGIRKATEEHTERIADLERQIELVRNAVLEEAAVKCDEEAAFLKSDNDGGSSGCGLCAAAIRAMKHEPNTTDEPRRSAASDSI